MAVKGKKIIDLYKKIDTEKFYELESALEILSSVTRKLDETVEIAMNLGVDPKHSDQMIRGLALLPNGTGKNIRVAVFAKDEKAKEAKEAGADIVGDEELIDQIQNGQINFDRAIATPDMMAKIGKIAKILGPKGLMPNPKLGTVTNNLKQAVKEAKAGQVEYKVEKNGIIHAGLGKLSFDKDKLIENILFFIKIIHQARPNGAKGIYIRKVTISSTMGPGIKLDPQQLIGKATAA